MRRYRSKKEKKLLVLIILLLGLSVGYAFITQTLSINGIGNISSQMWDIHFNNIQVSAGSVQLSSGDSPATINSVNHTAINYTVSFKDPGDFYEFTVDVVNSGNIHGRIGAISSKLNGVEIDDVHPLPAYVGYSVTNLDGTPIEIDHILRGGVTETYKVKLFYRDDVSLSALPTTVASFSLSFSVTFVQGSSPATSTATSTSSSSLPILSLDSYSINYLRDVYHADVFRNSDHQWYLYNAASVPVTSETFIMNINDDYGYFYYTPEEAISSYDGDDENFQYVFFAHTIDSRGNISANYLVFVITPEMEREDNNLTAGVYVLTEDNYKNGIILEEAFGSTNCNGGVCSNDYYTCDISHSNYIGCHPVSTEIEDGCAMSNLSHYYGETFCDNYWW